jgi:RNA polymerase sigma factor (sigma-70 family)
MNNAELLHEYRSDTSEAAFQALVERHLPLVYSAALRQVREPVLAENLSYVVFILLARKANELPQETILPDWLFRTTRRVIAKSLRGVQGGRRRQQRGYGLKDRRFMDVWDQVAPFFDAALAQLHHSESAAVLLHYFQFRRLEEVASALGISEEAAQRRIARAIHKLRRLLLAQGVSLPVEVLPGLLMTRGAQTAPSYLAASVTAAALSHVPVSTAVYALLQGAGREPARLKINPALWRIAAIAVITGLVMHFWPSRTSNDTMAYSFDSRIVIRPPYVAAPALSPFPVETVALKSSVADPVARTNNPAPPPPGVLQAQPAATNLLWGPGGTLADLTAAAPGPSDSGAPPEGVPTPDSGSSVQSPVWLSPYPPGYLPAQNVIRVDGGFHPIYSNNITPWTTPQGSPIVLPGRFRASAPPRKR